MKRLSIYGILRLILSLLFLPLSVIGVGWTQVKHESPLRFLIIAQDSTVATSSHFLAVDVELYNLSGREIRLSTDGLGTQIFFANRPCSLEDGVRTHSISLDPSPTTKIPEAVTIPPGGAYRRLLKLPLDREFFRPGIYSVRLSFAAAVFGSSKGSVNLGNLTSNELFFEVIDASSN